MSFDIDEFWAVIRDGTWPDNVTVNREQIYDDFGRLNGGPQDKVDSER